MGAFPRGMQLICSVFDTQSWCHENYHQEYNKGNDVAAVLGHQENILLLDAMYSTPYFKGSFAFHPESGTDNFLQNQLKI